MGLEYSWPSAVNRSCQRECPEVVGGLETCRYLQGSKGTAGGCRTRIPPGRWSVMRVVVWVIGNRAEEENCEQTLC